MSWVWTVMLSFGNEEYWLDGEDEPRTSSQALDNINTWLTADDVRRYGPLMDLVAGASGNEVGISANLYGAGFKHFDIEKFAEIVKSQEWHDPASVQLFIKGEEDEKFTLLPLEDL